MKMKRYLSALLALVLFAIPLAGCGGSTASQGGAGSAASASEVASDASPETESSAETIKIGVLLPLSGPSSYYGGVQLNGIEFCVDYINNTRGGIASMGGAKIELVVQDSASDPETGMSAFEKLVGEGVSAVIGPYNSTVGAATAPLALQHQVPYMVINSTSENFMGSPNKYVYRTNVGSSDLQILWGPIIDYLNEVRPDNPTDKIAVVYDSGDWGTASVTSWRDLAPRLGCELVIEEAVSESSTDLSTLVNKIKSSEVDFVILSAFSAASNLFVKQMAEYKCDAYIASEGGGVGDIEFIQNCGAAAEDVFYAAPWLPKYGSGSAFAEEMNQKFMDVYGYEITMEPSWGWLGMGTVANALERAGSADREALADAMYETDIMKNDDDPDTGWIMVFSGYDGVHFATDGQEKEAYATGWRYNNNDRLGPTSGMVLIQVQDGKWVVNYPESYNNGERTIHYE